MADCWASIVGCCGRSNAKETTAGDDSPPAPLTTTTATPSATATTTAAASADNAATPSSSSSSTLDAGAKMRQAALGAGKTKQDEEAVAAAAKKKTAAAAKMKKEKKEAAAATVEKKKAEDEEEAPVLATTDTEKFDWDDWDEMLDTVESLQNDSTKRKVDADAENNNFLESFESIATVAEKTLEAVAKVGLALKRLAQGETAKILSEVLSSAPFIGVAFQALLPVLEGFRNSGNVDKGLQSLLEQVNRLIRYVDEVITYINQGISSDEGTIQSRKSDNETIQSIMFVLQKCVVAANKMMKMRNDSCWIRNVWQASAELKELEALEEEIDTVLFERTLIQSMLNYAGLSHVKEQLIKIFNSLLAEHLKTQSMIEASQWKIIKEMREGFKNQGQQPATQPSVVAPETTIAAIPGAVPRPKGTFVKRLDQRELLTGAILPGSASSTAGDVSTNQSGSAAVVVVFGMGGSGKTTFIAEFVRSKDCRRAFNEIAWITLAQKEGPLSYKDLNTLYQRILYQLDIEDTMPAETVEAPDEEKKANARDWLDRCLRKLNILIVLDNVWRDEDIEWFRFGTSGESPSCILLVSTRIPRALKDDPGVLRIPIGFLTETEATELLARESHYEAFEEEDLTRAQTIVKLCGKLPLAVRTIGRMLRRDDSCISYKRLTLEQAVQAMSKVMILDSDPKTSLFAVLDLDFSPVLHGKEALGNQMKICFVSFACVFSPSNSPGYGPWVPASVVKALFRSVSVGTDGNLSQGRKWCTVEEQVLGKLLDLGLLDWNMKADDPEYRVHHDMHQEYGEHLSTLEPYNVNEDDLLTQRQEWHLKLLEEYLEESERLEDECDKYMLLYMACWLPIHVKKGGNIEYFKELLTTEAYWQFVIGIFGDFKTISGEDPAPDFANHFRTKIKEEGDDLDTDDLALDYVTHLTFIQLRAVKEISGIDEVCRIIAKAKRPI